MPGEQHQVESSLDLEVAEDQEINIDALFDPATTPPAGPTLDDEGNVILADPEELPEPEPELDDEGNPIIQPPAEDKPREKPANKPEETPPAANPEDYVPGEYIKAINDEYELGLHMENLPKDLTMQGEMDVAKQILEKRRVENDATLKSLTSYDQLIQSDAETQQYLKDRAAGLTMRDMVAKYGNSAAYTDEDAQVVESMKQTLGLDEAQANAAIEQMKTAGTYEDRKKQIVEHNVQIETQRAIDEQTRVDKANADAIAEWDAQKVEIKSYLDKTEGFGDFKLDAGIKKDLYNTVTLIDKEGLTQLDRDVQSTENSIKAALAIKYWAQIEQAIKSVGINKGKASAFDLLHTDPQELQKSSSQQTNPSDGIDVNLANMM